MLSACADLPKTPAERAEAKTLNDPLEPFNRNVFDVNDFLDRLLIRPLAELYRAMVPPPIRDRITGITSNMGEPVILANNLLQGEFGKAETTLERFGANTIVGVGGMFDVATGWGLPKQSGDFGQTLNSWGVAEGPYLVLPLFGPSNFRDALGFGVDGILLPWNHLAYLDGNGTGNRFLISQFSAQALTQREQNIESVDSLKAGSLDFYAQLRSVYRQYRAKQLGNPSASTMPKFEDYN